MPCPFSMDSVTTIRAVARPAATPSMVIPSAWDAASAAYIASALARASSSGCTGYAGSPRGAQVGFFGELADGRVDRGLALDVHQTGRQLPQVSPDRVPVLPHEHQPVVLVQRHDAHRAGVQHVVAHRGAAARHLDLVSHDV